MLKNFSKKWSSLLLLPIWVFVSFVVSELFVIIIYQLLLLLKVPINDLPSTLLALILSISVYTVMLAIVIGVPYVLAKNRVSLKMIGLHKLPTWTELLLAPAGFVIYVILLSVVIMAVQYAFPGFDVSQVQTTGFENISVKYQYYIAFIVLVVLAPVAEEVLFRGYLFSKLRVKYSFWLTALVVSVTFGAIHGAWNVGIDTFVLSLMLCLLREQTGKIWAPVLLHMLKNGLAFFVLFIYPLLSITLGS